MKKDQIILCRYKKVITELNLKAIKQEFSSRGTPQQKKEQDFEPQESC